MRPNAPLNVSIPNRRAQLVVDLFGQGRGTEQAQGRVRLRRARLRHLGSVDVVRQQIGHRAERRRDRRADPVHLRPEVRHREPAVDRTAAAVHERAEHRGDERVVVEQRQWGPHDVVGGALPAHADLTGQRLVVVVAEHAALRRSGRAAGVDEGGEIRRSDRHIGRRVVAAQHVVPLVHGDLGRRVHLGAPARIVVVVADDHVLELRQLGQHRCDTVGERALHHDDLRPRVAELVPQVLAFVRSVDRHRDRAPRTTPNHDSNASGEFSTRLATRSPGRTPSSRSALARVHALRFTSAVVNATPHTSRY